MYDYMNIKNQQCGLVVPTLSAADYTADMQSGSFARTRRDFPKSGGRAERIAKA